jgi:hypothetical protein
MCLMIEKVLWLDKYLLDRGTMIWIFHLIEVHIKSKYKSQSLSISFLCIKMVGIAKMIGRLKVKADLLHHKYKINLKSDKLRD